MKGVHQLTVFFHLKVLLHFKEVFGSERGHLFERGLYRIERDLSFGRVFGDRRGLLLR